MTDDEIKRLVDEVLALRRKGKERKAERRFQAALKANPGLADRIYTLLEPSIERALGGITD